jgi:TldD protein
MQDVLNPLEVVRSRLLAPVGLGDQELEGLLDIALGGSVQSADLYFQRRRHESWLVEESRLKEGGYSLQQGVGVRATSGEKAGFAYTDEIALPALRQAALAARAIARSGQRGEIQAWRKGADHNLYAAVDPLDTLDESGKIALMLAVDREARRVDPRLSQVFVSLTATHDLVLIVTSEGTLAADVRPLVRLDVTVIAEAGGRREQASAGGGARTGYGYLLEADRGLAYAREAARRALVNLEAEEAPAGSMTVVLGPGWPGILLHEAIGHGLEGDFNRKGSSAFAGRLGERVASPLCTVVDDGTLPQSRGSLGVDDEGTPTQQTVLIEQGILRGYMQDRLNARLTGTSPTGNGRRQSYAHPPLPRMTNTYMLAGEYSSEEIIASVDRGLYAVNFGGGQVDITSGKFVFSANEAYLIEGGRVTRPVKGATLIGNGPDVLSRVSMVGNDLKLDPGIGTCGKDGQSVPVGVGQPTIRVDDLTVGGTRP